MPLSAVSKQVKEEKAAVIAHDCPICLAELDLTDAVSFCNIGHYAHRECLRLRSEGQRRCPICRNDDDLTVNDVLRIWSSYMSK
jgi:hypothetical protein